MTKDADLRYTSNGTAVASFTVAVNRQFTNQSGEREADFINCVAWRKTAETLANFTKKGSLVGVEGRIQTRSYDNQQGQKVYVTEIVVDNFSMLEPKSVTDQRRAHDTGSTTPSASQLTRVAKPRRLSTRLTTTPLWSLATTPSLCWIPRSPPSTHSNPPRKAPTPSPLLRAQPSLSLRLKTAATPLQQAAIMCLCPVRQHLLLRSP